MAGSGAGRPPVRDRRPGQGRLPGIEPDAVRRGAPRAGRPGLAVPATQRRGARGDHPPGPADGPDRPGRPDRDRPEDRTEDGTLHRDRPDDPEDLRPRAPRPRDLPALDRPARRGDQGQDLSALQPRPGRLGGEPRRPVRPDPVEHLPGHQRDAGPPAQGIEAGVHAASRASTTPPPATRSSARCPSRSTASPRGGPRPPRGCPPTWPASTRSRS